MDSIMDDGKFLREVLGSVAEVTKALDTHKTSMDSRIDAIEREFAKGLNPNRPGNGNPSTGLDIGSIFTKSAEFTNAFGGFNPESNDRSYATRMAKANVGSVVKAILSGATGVPDKTRMAGIVPGTPMWPSWVFQRLAQGTMTGGVLEYVQDTSAAIDHTVPPTAEGQPKPSVAKTFELKQLMPKTVAHWIEASKQILADAAALGSYLNSVLLYDLMLKLEYQVLHGDGTGSNMNGIYAQAADLGAAVPGEQRIDRLARSVAVVNAQGFNCNFVALNPVDAVDVQLTKNDVGDYIWGTPQNGLPPALWGVPIVASPMIPATKFLVGDGSRAQLFEREGANVAVGFQNDNFTRNLVTMLAELRADVATYNTAAFKKGSLTTVAP